MYHCIELADSDMVPLKEDRFFACRRTSVASVVCMYHISGWQARHSIDRFYKVVSKYICDVCELLLVDSRHGPGGGKAYFRKACIQRLSVVIERGCLQDDTSRTHQDCDGEYP